MRAFLLIALLAMATTVSCQSAECNTTSAALDVPSVKDAEKAIVRGGCEGIKFDDPNLDKACPLNEALNAFYCNCTTTLNNTDGWVNAVTNSSGKACFYDLTFRLYGNDNSNQSVEIYADQKNASVLAVGKDCSEDDIMEKFKSIAANATLQFVNSRINDISPITWTTGTVSVFSNSCGASFNSERVPIPPRTATNGTTAPPTVTTAPPTTTMAPTTNGTTSAPTGNTSAPTGNGTTLSPTSTPTSGGNTTTPPTTPPQGGDASSIAASLVLVASLIAATVTIVA